MIHDFYWLLWSVLLGWKKLPKAVQIASPVNLQVGVLLPVTMTMPFQKGLHAEEITCQQSPAQNAHITTLLKNLQRPQYTFFLCLVQIWYCPYQFPSSISIVWMGVCAVCVGQIIYYIYSTWRRAYCNANYASRCFFLCGTLPMPVLETCICSPSYHLVSLLVF